MGNQKSKDRKATKKQLQIIPFESFNTKDEDWNRFTDEYWSKAVIVLSDSEKRSNLGIVVRYCVQYGNLTLLKWYCLTDLFGLQYWKREHLKEALVANIVAGKGWGKFAAIKVMVSYGVPHIVRPEELTLESGYQFKDYQNGSVQHFGDFFNEIVDLGMQECAGSIVSSREGLHAFNREFMADSLPNDVLYVILTFVGGGRDFKSILEMDKEGRPDPSS
ncbi:hypothetical protein RFI_07745 [Reticulomyxa filosa]|uniref:Uncharacterized protein n=1 Tax=Reticulomyxa filosa TaxID=46433 RepID=X6NSY9_RETFI|nr:hypothetical protein RFI_07745 [Reticulomyxa filosa]|eukprot:ETO29375.1 hypothetical protein RFI_07745 [Reticulomyxa filosa]